MVHSSIDNYKLIYTIDGSIMFFKGIGSLNLFPKIIASLLSITKLDDFGYQKTFIVILPIV